MADPKNRQEALGWMQRNLGGGVVVLEVEEEHVDDAFDDALRWFTARKGIDRLAAVNLSSGVQEYAAPDDCDEVIEMYFPGVQLDIIAAVNPYAFIDIDQLPVAYQSITGVPGGSFYGTLHQILSHAETARRVVGSEPAWEYHKATNTVLIYPRNQRSGSAVIRYISTTINTEDPEDEAVGPKNDFRTMRFRERDIILRYASQQLKLRLGRVRSKYTDWPSAGGSKSMDGDSLVTEALGEIEKLDEEVKALAEPVPFLVG